MVCTVYYGHLEYLLHCIIPPNPVIKNTDPKYYILTIVTTCDTQGRDATWEPMYFRSVRTYVEVIDVATICAGIGHMQVGTIDPQ